MGKEIVGLKIGASGVVAARVAGNASAELVQVARKPLPPGVVGNGEVRDPSALADTLRALFKEHKLPRRSVRVGIGNNRIGVRMIEVSGVGDGKQMANAMRFRAQDALPIPIDQAVLDFQVVSEFVDDEGVPAKRVLLVVAYRDLVDAYVQACAQAGIRLVGVDLEAFALLRALTPGEPPETTSGERTAVVAVAIGSERSTLAVTDGTTCEFTRVLDWGGASLTAAVAMGLEVEVDVAERIKRKLALEAEDGPEGVTDEQAAEARNVVRARLERFARELVSSLEYYQSQPDSLAIREVVLAGGTANLDGLAPALQRLIGVAVRVGDPLATVSVGAKVEGAHDPALAVPIGLAVAA